jgi:acetyl-CoA acetyltransferase
MSWIVGVGLTPFGNLSDRSTLDLMSEAAASALESAQFERGEIDGLLCGYSTTLPHLMLATLFSEHFGLMPHYAHSVQMGGATGFAMAMLAHHLVDGGVVDRMLVVAGENRLSGQSRNSAIHTLAQVGHPDYEVPLGLTVPGYYALVASRYMHEYRISENDLAQLAVLMRKNAMSHAGAHFRDAITVDDVLSSRVVAEPLRLLDCCPVSDGAAAFVVCREKPKQRGIKIRSAAQAHTHQHISAAPSLVHFGAAESSHRALSKANIGLSDIGYAAVYDSFTITLAILLEEIGFCPRGQVGQLARAGYFDSNGRLPLNTHGGLLSYGHCGVGGALAHLVETYRQLTQTLEANPISSQPAFALLHGDGGVLSSHVSLVVERVF